ncbi:DUF6912 family protein, partial [Streptomyces albidoflavus]
GRPGARRRGPYTPRARGGARARTRGAGGGAGAPAGDGAAQFVVDGADDHELLWFATQEIAHLVAG